MSITLFERLRYGWQILEGARVAGERQIDAERHRDIAGHLDRDTDLIIVDLGNGSLRPQHTILTAGGHLVLGIDLVNRPRRGLIGLAYAVARAAYRWKLGLSVRSSGEYLICGDVACLPLRTEAVDLVTSVAAFEHFLDVPAVLAEAHRILKPGGIMYARIHLFSCPSGGHNVRVAQVPLMSLPRGVDAWDHLRRQQLALDVPLNEWRKHQYLEEFQKRFKVLKEYCAMREGEHLLNPQIAGELSDYTPDELTCAAYVIVAQKTKTELVY